MTGAARIHPASFLLHRKFVYFEPSLHGFHFFHVDLSGLQACAVVQGSGQRTNILSVTWWSTQRRSAHVARLAW